MTEASRIQELQSASRFRLECVEDDLEAKRRVFQTRAGLRQVYHGWYGRIASRLVPGRTLEIGGGAGGFKDYFPALVSSDIVRSPYLDVVCDAARLPFADGAFDNVVCVDVIHHVFELTRFFGEVERVLSPGGRFAFVEPYLSPFARAIRGRYHFEPFWFDFDLEHPAPAALDDKKPIDSNMAIPTVLFDRRLAEFRRRFPRLAVVERERRDCLAYPLTAGMNRRSILPERWIQAIHRLEPLLAPLARLLAFKIFVVLEKVE